MPKSAVNPFKQSIKLKDHYDNVAKLGCVLSRTTNPQLHHVYGGSIKDKGFVSGMGMRGVSEYWVIPLNEYYHTGDMGIHKLGIWRWEALYRTQWTLLHSVWRALGYELDLEGNEL